MTAIDILFIASPNTITCNWHLNGIDLQQLINWITSHPLNVHNIGTNLHCIGNRFMAEPWADKHNVVVVYIPTSNTKYMNPEPSSPFSL